RYLSNDTVVLHSCALFFFSSRRRHTRWPRDWSSDVCSSDLVGSPFSLSGGTGEPTYPEVPSNTSFWSRTSFQFGPEMVSVGKLRSEERRVGKSVERGCRRMIDKIK